MKTNVIENRPYRLGTDSLFRSRIEILEIRPNAKAARVEDLPETHQQLGRHTGQPRRGVALHERLHVLLQRRELLQVQRQDVCGKCTKRRRDDRPRVSSIHERQSRRAVLNPNARRDSGKHFTRGNN